MTTTATESTAALNGQAPPAAGDDDGGQAAAPVSERIMGLIGIALAAGLLAIGIDLATGGALSRMLAGSGEQHAGNGG